VREAAALVPLPVVCAAGALLARIWIARAPRAVAGDLAQPLPVVTAWGGYGALGFAILAATLLAATLALVVAGRGRRADARVVVAIAAAALAADLAWPAIFSSDVYAYAAYGDLAGRGLDPYVLAPDGLHDAFLDGARVQWTGRFPVCVYGPAFVNLMRVVVGWTAGFGVSATLAVLRAGACAAFLGSIAFLALALRAQTHGRRSLALYAYGLNPVALWSVAEGHNDAYLMLAATAALAWALRRDAVVGTFALALGPLVKAPGTALAVAFAVRTAWLSRERPRGVWLALLAGTGVAAALTLPALLPALRHVGSHGVYAPAASVQGLVGPAGAAFGAGALLLYAAALLWRRDPRGFAWTGLALYAALPNAYPWYALWLLPLAIAAGPGPAAAALWGATIFSAVRYLPDAIGNISAETARVASAVATLPFALALGEFRPFARRKTKLP
jgi:hypothetical protein